MVNCGRSRTISTVICLVIFSAYMYVEFVSKRLVTIQPQTGSGTDGTGNTNVVLDHVQQIQREGEWDWAYKLVKDNDTSPDTNDSDKEDGDIHVTIVTSKNETETTTLSVKVNDSIVTEKQPEENKLQPHTKNEYVQSEVIVRPFEADKPKMILLLAQQRVGSTFIGGIFDKNTNALYVYEPLEGVYTHMYGTAKGWNVPLDIHFHWNKTHRPLPPYEAKAVAQLIEQIFTCDFRSMITEFLVHEFWYGFRQTQALPYSNCIKQIKVSVSACQPKLKGTCNGRVGQNLQKERLCFEQLKAVFSGQQAQEPFKRYKTCMDEQRKKVMSKCVPIIEKTCNSKPLHVIKTVRMDLETILPLMDKYQNMRVIHLIRDPRSVVLSRIKSGWSTHGTTNNGKARTSLKATNHNRLPSSAHVNGTIDFEDFSLNEEMKLLPKAPNGVAQEAQMYCSLTRKDIITRRYIEEKYPGSTYQMIYDHMVSHPLHELERIYEFIDEPIPDPISNWVKGINSGAKTSQSIAAKWRKEMTVETAKEIDAYCQNLYDTIEYSWPDP